MLGPFLFLPQKKITFFHLGYPLDSFCPTPSATIDFIKEIKKQTKSIE